MPDPPSGPAAPDLQTVTQQLRVLAAGPDAGRIGLGMATHSFAELVDRALQGGDPGWLTFLWHEAVESVAAMPDLEAAAAERRLIDAGVGGLGPAVAAYLGGLRRIEQRGRLTSEEERGPVQDRYARIHRAPGFEEEAGRLRALLATWEPPRTS